MHCCLMTIEENLHLKPPKEGDKLKCVYCSHWIIFHDRAWEWGGGPRA